MDKNNIDQIIKMSGKESDEFHSKEMMLPVQEQLFKTKKLEDCVKRPTNYLETLMHLFKGNIGSGIFAMGDAFKNSGMVLGPIAIPILGLICVHCQHLLVNASNYVQYNSNLCRNPDYATTVEMSFATGPIKTQSLSRCMKTATNVFLCLTQLGFCCIYFVFIGSNLKQVMDHYGLVYSVHIHMAFALLPILLSCLVRNLKYLAPLSTVANAFMLTGILITLYYACQKPFAHVETVADVEKIPLFFGTTLFAFEGIGLVLPLQSEMKKPYHFNSTLGVLNVGMLVVTILYTVIGAFSYLKYGVNVQGSVTLNLPLDEILAQCVKAMITLGILLTFALQFYIAIEIMFPVVQKRLGPFKKPVLAETAFRIVFVLITFFLAEVIPALDLFISLVGAFCNTSISLIFPPILEFITSSKVTPWMVIKNGAILSIGVLGCATGSYESIKMLLKAFTESN